MNECYFHLAKLYSKNEDTSMQGKECIDKFLKDADESEYTHRILGDAYFLAGCLELRISNGDMEKAIKYHEKAAYYQHPQSLVVCGSHYIESDAKKGNEYLESAFNQHENVFAIDLMLSKSANKGIPISQDVLKKVIHLAESDKYFMYLLGDHLLKGTLQSTENNIVNLPTQQPTEGSVELGRSYLVKAANENHTGASLVLFRLYSDIYEDNEAAKEVLEKALVNPDTTLIDKKTIGQLHYIYANLLLEDEDNIDKAKEHLKVAAYRFENLEARNMLHDQF
eukprot:CAMPEP_0117423850 /NCGR_PEP_ID=MMETSP0758-20121206/4386_1 /TAXON_ID=63605 /ORGANISM="Percolomonas cosmopolitus, Strain AE-1 (ATCC 50343)" /LENGTH=280 /DNA_ID=CAMNT_0005207275 /DNA_START=590 /DNA_END=1432 /DNA_ORIENTATION=+